ncbi:MAG: hypothetical protein EXS36_15440, partial [Pedosphaera sp.]|nr:hypothetical protein [Pedosphaera sp.]
TSSGVVVEADSIEVVVLGNDDNFPLGEPVVVMDRPPNGDSIQLGDVVILEATAVVPKGIVSSLQFFEGNTVIAQAWDAGCPPCLSVPCPARPCLLPVPGAPSHFFYYWSNAPAGIHEIHARAVSDTGVEFHSKPVVFKLTPVSPFPTVTVKAIDNEASEGPDFNVAIFEISRSGNTQKPLTVWFNTAGSATRKSDYLLLTQFCTTPCRRLELVLTDNTVVIPEGERSILIGVKALHDDLVEGDESVVLQLVDSPTAGPIPPYVLGSQTEDKIVIHDFSPDPQASLVITGPKYGELFKEPALIPIDCTAIDLNGSIRHVEYFANNAKIGQSDIWTKDADIPGKPRFHHFEWSSVKGGKYSLFARSKSAIGVIVESAPVVIVVVESPVHTIPVVTVEAIQREALESDAQSALVYRVSRTGATTDWLAINYRFDGTATFGKDYDIELFPIPPPPNGVINFFRVRPGATGRFYIPSGANSVKIVAHPIPDLSIEGAESVVLNLLTETIDVINADRSISPKPVPAYIVGEPSAAKGVLIEKPLRALLTITSPDDLEQFVELETIPIRAVAIDPKGYIPTIEFYANDQKIGQSSLAFLVAPPDGTPIHHAFDWEKVPAGKYILTARATTASGERVTSEPVRIAVHYAQSTTPVVTIQAIDYRASENDPADIAIFEIHRTGDKSQPLNVAFLTDGSAKRDVDYVLIPESMFRPCPNCDRLEIIITDNTIAIPANESSVRLGVRALPDDAKETDETVAVRLLQPPSLAVVGAKPIYYVGQPGEDKILITERGSGASIVITQPRNGSSFSVGADITIEAVAADPDSYISQVDFFADGKKIGASSIVFIRAPDPGTKLTHEFIWKNSPPGKHELKVAARDDSRNIVSEPVWIVVDSLVHLAPVVTVYAKKDHVKEWDPKDELIFKFFRSGNNSAPLPVYFTLSGTAKVGSDYIRDLGNEPESDPSAAAGASNGVDPAFPLGGIITFPAGSSEASLMFHPVPEDRLEGDEVVVVDVVLPPLDRLAFRPLPYGVGEPGAAKGVIVEKLSKPYILIERPENDTYFAAGDDVVIRATAVDPEGAITHVVFCANGKVIGESTITFIRAPDPGTPIQHEFVWKNPPAEGYQLTVKSEVGNAHVVSNPVNISVEGILTLPLVTVSTSNNPIFEPTPGRPDATTFLLTRSGNLGRPITVFYSVGGTAKNGRDYTFLDGDVTIPAGVAERKIVVQALADREIEETETVILTLRPGRLYTLGADTTAQISILDADKLPGAKPSIVMTDPDDNAEFKAPAEIPIRISTFDPDGFIAFAEFFANDIKIGEEGLSFPLCVGCGPKPGSVLTIPFNWKNVPAGKYKLVAKGKSSSGEIIASESIQITVFGSDTTVPVLHPADLAPADSSLTMEEIKPYALAWKSGTKWSIDPNPIPVSYVTRAGALWKGGEKYVRDPSVGPAPLWWVNVQPPPRILVPGGGGFIPGPADSVVEAPQAESAALAQWVIPTANDAPVQLVIRVLPAIGVQNYAVEEYLPIGAVIVDITEDGTYDKSNGAIRWGPFFGATPRKLSFAVVGAWPEKLEGIASFDGQDFGIVHVPLPPTPERAASIPGGKGQLDAPRIAHVIRLQSGAIQLTVIDDTPDSKAGCDVEVSDDFKHWQKIGHLDAGANCGTHLDNDANEYAGRYYRVVRRQ